MSSSFTGILISSVLADIFVKDGRPLICPSIHDLDHEFLSSFGQIEFKNPDPLRHHTRQL